MPTMLDIDLARTSTYNYVMKPPCPKTLQAQTELDAILTIPEVCKAYFVAPSTVRYWIARGYIQARHATIWLISVTSLQEYRGPAPNIRARAQHTRPRP